MATRSSGAVPLEPPRRLLTITVDGVETRVPEGATILDACRGQQVDTPTLCYAENLTPVNACRVCVVEVEGSRTLVPACSRTADDGMKVTTDTERVRHSRTLVMEFLASSVEMDLTSPDVHRWMNEYEVHPERFGSGMAELPAGERDARGPGHHHEPADPTVAEGVSQPVKVDNELYVRDYSRCILCYKCVEACGVDAQNTFAIAVAGRGFDARISTEYAVPLDESACVYCGNCIGVCPTGALMFTSEHEMRADGSWNEQEQTVTNTICPYCGVGCELELHVQDNEIVKVSSPSDHSVTNGHLCIKGRFGFAYVQSRKEDDPTRRRKPTDRGAASLTQISGLASGVVLAGGRSSRFGSDKLAASHAGMPLLVHAVLRFAEVTGDVVVVLAPDAPEPSMPPGAPVRYARDPQEGEGPLAGAIAGLDAVDREVAVIAGGDMPGMSTAVVLEMLRLAGEAQVEAVALQDGGRFRPLPVVVRVARARELGHALLHDGERSLRGWLEAMRVAVLDEATWTAFDPGRETLRDVDEPGDLDRA